MYHVAAYSNVGVVKKSNQDSSCVEVAQTAYGDTALLAVCDGVGGLASGEVASASVIRWLCNWYERRFARLLEVHADNDDALIKAIQSDWTRGLRVLNETLRTYGRNTNQRMGTTFTAILFYGDSYLIGHVGDCRAYQVSEGTLLQLTEDQTWVAREVSRGTITPEQARSHPQRNVILQSVGTQEEIHPAFVQGKKAPMGSTYMVCCDGFRNELFDDEILAAFDFSSSVDEQDMHHAMYDLTQLAIRRGEKDNITAVCLCEAEGHDYGEPLIAYKAGKATVVEREEDALPTGYLEETESGV